MSEDNYHLDAVKYMTGYYDLPYTFDAPYPYSLESFKISDQLSVNVLTISTTDDLTYEHIIFTLAVIYE